MSMVVETESQLVGETLYTVMDSSPAAIVAGLLRVCFPDARTVLDVTYGSGKFWSLGTTLALTATDLDPERARDGVENFECLSFANGSFDVVVFDPPFLSDVGQESAMRKRFGGYSSTDALIDSILKGTRECWRVARLGLLFKGQDYVHASEKLFMSRVPELELGLPYEQVIGRRPGGKILSQRWGEQLSAYSNSATYSVWRKDGFKHIRRGGR